MAKFLVYIKSWFSFLVFCFKNDVWIAKDSSKFEDYFSRIKDSDQKDMFLLINLAFAEKMLEKVRKYNDMADIIQYTALVVSIKSKIDRGGFNCL